MSLTRSFPTLIIMTAVLGACSGAEQPGDAQDTSELSAEEIARLAEQYPRLGSDPLPQPRPSDAANPEQPPRAITGSLTREVLETVSGSATFYANQFEGRRTASGIPFRQNQMVAAHRAFPFGTILRVTNLRNDRSVNVRVVDRGPFGASASRGTIIDLSRRAAEDLDFINAGRAQVRVEVLEWGRGITSA